MPEFRTSIDDGLILISWRDPFTGAWLREWAADDEDAANLIHALAGYYKRFGPTANPS